MYGFKRGRIYKLARAGALPIRKNGRASSAPAPEAGEQGIEGQIVDLRRRLNSTAAQQPQFDALAQVMRQNDVEMTQLAAKQPCGKPNAVDAVRAAQQIAQADAEGLGRMLPKLEALYGTLSDQQKRAADQLFARGPDEEQEQPPAPKRR